MADVTQLIDNWRSDTTGLSDSEQIMKGDLNRDGTTNLADWWIMNQAWNAQGGAVLDLEALLAASESRAQLREWAGSFGASQEASQAEGDLDHDGDVDGGDFLVWQRSFVASPIEATAESSEIAPSEQLSAASAPPMFVKQPVLALNVNSTSGDRASLSGSLMPPLELLEGRNSLESRVVPPVRLHANAVDQALVDLLPQPLVSLPLTAAETFSQQADTQYADAMYFDAEDAHLATDFESAIDEVMLLPDDALLLDS